MKIALVPGSCFEDATMRSVLSGLRRALADRGHEPTIVSPPAAISRSLKFRNDRSVPRFRTVRELARIVDRRGIDAVHLHFSGRLRPWMRGLAAPGALGAAKLVVTFQDFEHPELPRNSAADHRVLARILTRAPAATAVSEFLAGKVARAFHRKIAAIPNGASLASRRARRRRRPYILSVGRLAPYKGTDLLLMAFAGVKDPGVELVLCGAPFDRRLAALPRALGLQGRVRLLGLREPREVAALMKGCLFYAAAPRAETFGMAIVEAMAAGKAVLATSAGAVPEHVRHGQNGLLVPSRDVAALTRGLERLLSDAALRSRLGRAGRRTAARLSWERAAAAYLASYAGRRPT